MPYCAACFAPAAVIHTSTNTRERHHREAAACAEHTTKTRAWAAQTGAPVDTQHLAQDPGQAPPPHQQQELFTMTGGCQ